MRFRKPVKFLDFLTREEDGEEQMEYLLIVAMIVLPLLVAVTWLWEMLIRYYSVIRFTVDMPFF